MKAYVSVLLAASWATVWIVSAWTPVLKQFSRVSAAKLYAAEDEEPDLFDYFDPLLSPHAYPDGVSPDNKPMPDANRNTFPLKAPSSFGIEYRSDEGTSSDSPANEAPNGDDSDDLFEYFDPLLSPHSYPNGIRPDRKPRPLQVESLTGDPLATDEQDDRYNPLRFGKSKELDRSAASSSTTSGKIGILLMDHGSRNEASNNRLKYMAELYQLTIGDENIIVEAAHMEIAKPSIPEGLGKLMARGVEEIVCHPYFLSPGRHVREDIPAIVNEAIVSLNIDIPVSTTEPVGSNTQLMIGAIHSLVRENSELLRAQRKQSQ